MIGIGNWGLPRGHHVLQGGRKVHHYRQRRGICFELHMDGPIPEFQIKEIKEENDDTLHAIANVEMLPGKDIDVALTFAGDTFNGVIKVPFLGKIKLNNGYRLAE